jgi:hypothetical protein
MAPSSIKETTGASKQPSHSGRNDPHEEKVDSTHGGEQRWCEAVPRIEPTDDTLPVDFGGRGQPDYSEDHARVFTALTLAQEERNGEGIYLDEIADGAGLPESETRDLLHDLTTAHHLVAELEGSDTPDLGPATRSAPASEPSPLLKRVSSGTVDHAASHRPAPGLPASDSAPAALHRLHMFPASVTGSISAPL